jgi:hypothetical protein
LINLRSGLQHWADAVIGIYIGTDIDPNHIVHCPLDDFIHGIEKYGMGQTLQTQSCSRDTSGSTFGIIADVSSGIKALSVVRAGIATRSNGQCEDGFDQVSRIVRNTVPSKPFLGGFPVEASGWNCSGIEMIRGQIQNMTAVVHSGYRLRRQKIRMELYAPNECTTTEMESGDSCGKLAERCGISGNKFSE